MAQQNKHREFNLEVKAHLSGSEAGDKPPEAVAYAFSRGGKLLGSESIEGRKGVSLKLKLPSEATAVRVLVGPRVDPPHALDELLRRGAKEQHLRVEAKDTHASLGIEVVRDAWLCWILSACFVRGTLLKRITTGGVHLDLPVCHARVEIFEVDPIWLIVSKLPDDILDKLRHLILQPQPVPVPVPDPGPLRLRSLSASHHSGDAAAALQQATESSELLNAARLGSTLEFQKALVTNAAITRALFCIWYPHFVSMEKVGEAYTNDCGHFETIFFKGCQNHDTPDLYFKAYQRIFGFFEIEIYAPTPIACHTWWDYACGSEVTLYTTSPLAVTCAPCPPVIGPDNWVLFTAVGNTSVKAIFGAGAPGASASNWGLTEGGAPWGGTLRPRLDFDNALRDSLGVFYYQLSWRKGTSGKFTPLNAEVSRHYTHVVGGDLVIEPYKLGPHPMVVGGDTLQLYEIPPSVPPIGKWTIANAVLDTENGEFDSVLHSHGLSFDLDGVASGTDESGLYQLQLELFDVAGTLINIGAKGIKFVVPDSVSLSGTIHTVNANTILQPGGGTLVVGNSLVLTLHIDNNHCWADIAAPSTPVGTADPCCGVVAYAPSDPVNMPYTAYHPHGFATHALNIFRSATQILPTITGGVGSFTITESVLDMMTLALPPVCVGKPVCIMAAFSEHLDVAAMATDGWGSYLGYNAVRDRAFALKPV